MEKKLIILVALFVICSVAASTFAAEMQWFGAAHDQDWFNTANWGPAGGPVPGTMDKAKLNHVWNNLGPKLTTAMGVGEIFISEDPEHLGEQNFTVAVGGNVVTGTPGYDPVTNPVGYAGQVNLGYSAAWGNVGKLVMDGGTMTVSQHLWVGWGGKGILQMNSGTLNTNQMLGIGWGGGTGEVHLNGGLLHSAQWWGGDPTWLPVHNYTFDVAGGTWEIHGYWVDEINGLVSNGWITAYRGTEAVNVAWDADREITVVTPEPITLSLLGLGALLLRRRS